MLKLIKINSKYLLFLKVSAKIKVELVKANSLILI